MKQCLLSFLPGGPGDDHNSSFMVPFLVFQVFNGSLPKPSANHDDIPANKIDLGSYQGWSTLSSYLYYIYMYTSHPVLLPFLGLENPSDLPNRVAISLQEPRSEPGGCYAKAGFKLESSRNAYWGKKEHSGSEWQKMKKVPTWSMWVPKRQVDQEIRFFSDFPVIFSVFVGTCDKSHFSGWQVGKLVNIRHWLR